MEDLGAQPGQVEIKMAQKPWPVVVGCEVLTEGCESCPSYHSSIANKGVRGHIFEHSYNVRVIDNEITTPLANPGPTIYLVAFGSDLFHEAVTGEKLQQIFEVMNKSTRHVFEIKTKRVERMVTATKQFGLKWTDNILAGIGLESADYKYRIDQLRKLDCKAKFISMVPLLGPMGKLNLKGIGCVGVAPETWGEKRPCNPEWMEKIKSQCKAQKVEFLEQEPNIWSDH
jgi:protein gp37